MTGPDGANQGSSQESRQSLYVTAAELRLTARTLITRAVAGVANAESLHRESASLVEAAAKLRADVQTSITSYAATMRDLGEPAERVVITVKQIADEAERHVRLPVDIADLRTLRTDLVRWTIDGYYASS